MQNLKEELLTERLLLKIPSGTQLKPLLVIDRKLGRSGSGRPIIRSLNWT